MEEPADIEEFVSPKEPIEATVKKWLELHESGTKGSIFIRDYWRTVVPEIFAPQPNISPTNSAEQEELAQKHLYAALDLFIANLKDPEEVYTYIGSVDSPPALCGRVFNNGEPTYGCRDCGFDPTCVLCADCFKNSDHNAHRYKMSTSSGGGYCDCGDVEAWKQSPHCIFHVKAPEQEDDPSKILPPDLLSRIHAVVETVVEYCLQMLTHTDTLSLPPDLEVPDTEPTRNPNLYKMRDRFCTVLYNDEIHTYQQVMNALELSIRCTKKEAVHYVTFIDREGRCVVKVSGLQQCQEVKATMERHTNYPMVKPFLIKIFKVCVQAHQLFAASLLNWMEKLLDRGNNIKEIFSEVLFNVASGETMSTVERIMRSDGELCKSARVQWHKLIIAGVLMDLDNKRKFARLYVKNYSAMMKEFIRDDHDHSVCIVSLGVQLFTMPTIAHMLIAEESVIAKIILTFISECHSRIIDGKLKPMSSGQAASNVPASMTVMEFRRIQFVMFDLKYLLGLVPSKWTDSLRRGFLHGFDQFVKLLCHMQNMDPIERKEGVHVEYEQEWEGSFNLQIKLSPILPMLVAWAASDRVVLIRSLRIALKAVHSHGCKGMNKRFMREAAEHTFSCIEYDVAKNPVSLHIPLTRLVTSLLLCLPQHGLTFTSTELAVESKPLMRELLEPALRTIVMASQVKCGMWKHNGLSLSNQIYFYRNVRCRQEMSDRDVQMMQYAAAHMDPNEFLITLLNKFSLMSWQRTDYDTAYLWGKDEDNMVKNVLVLEEFLLLLLYIMAERYAVGIGDVTQEDVIKHEIIHLLCVQNMTHSHINKLLPEGPNHETGMEDVIGDIAKFVQVSGETKGYYELKPEYYDRYNMFFYHYTKEDHSKSEYEHRKKRCGNVSPENAFCVPPCPPEFTDTFKPVLSIFNCDVFRHIITQIVERWHGKRSYSISETAVQICLHLLGVACHEEFRTKNVLRDVAEVESLVTKIQTCQRSSQLAPLAGWVKTKLRAGDEEVTQGSAGAEDSSAVAGSSADNNSEMETEVISERQRKAAEARARKQKILSKMTSMQEKFMKKHKTLFQEEGESEEQSTSTVEPMDVSDDLPIESIAVGAQQILPKPSTSTQNCILCHQDENIRLNYKGPEQPLDPNTSEKDLVASLLNCPEKDRLMVVGVMVQPSTVLSRKRKEFCSGGQPLYLPADMHKGIHVSTCGHPMHVLCWKQYHNKVLQKEQRRNNRLRPPLTYDIERSEFLCPLCEAVCNDAVPLVPPTTQPMIAGLVQGIDVPSVSPTEWLEGLFTIFNNKAERIIESKLPSISPGKGSVDEEDDEPPAVSGKHLPPSLSTIADIIDSNKNHFSEFFSSEYNMARPAMLPGAEVVMWDLAHSIFRHGLDVNPNVEDERILGCVLSALAYTLRSREEVQRFEGRALLTNFSERQHMMLQGLVTTAACVPSLVATKQSAAVSTSACVSVLSDILGGDSNVASVLEFDAFSAMVSLIMMLPTVFSTTHATAKGGLQDQYVMQMCFYAHIVQLLLTYDQKPQENSPEKSSPEGDSNSHEQMETEEQVTGGVVKDSSSFSHVNGSDVTDETWLHELLGQCRKVLGISHTPVQSGLLLSYVKERCLPFLRCCGLFFHLLTGCPGPEELKSSVWVPESEYYCLLRFLGLPSSLQQTLQEFAALLSDRWLSHPRLRECVKERTFNGHKVLTVNQLTPLAKDYSELISEAANFVCPSTSSGDKSSTPTICLVCGTFMCSQTYCCQLEQRSPNSAPVMVGSTTHHSYTCSGGSCMFLRVWDCRVILRISRLRGCYYNAPYLDRYGETDVGLRRGNPLYLNSEHYNKLHLLWLKHLIPETVTRTLAAAAHMGVTDWQHL